MTAAQPAEDGACRCGHETHRGRCMGCVTCLQPQRWDWQKGADGHKYQRCTCTGGTA